MPSSVIALPAIIQPADASIAIVAVSANAPPITAAEAPPVAITGPIATAPPAITTAAPAIIIPPRIKAIPSSVTSVGSNPFNLCSDVENLVIEQDFDVANFTIAGFGNLSVPTVVSVLNSLSNRVGKTNYTLYTGRYLSMLSEEQKAIATNKNWTLR